MTIRRATEADEAILREFWTEFEAEVREENLIPEQIAAESERYLQLLQNVGAGVIRRWIELL